MSLFMPPAGVYCCFRLGGQYVSKITNISRHAGQQALRIAGQRVISEDVVPSTVLLDVERDGEM